MSNNRFARRLEELDPEERQLAEAAVQAARTSFAGFAEKPGPDYHQAPGLTAEETWTRVAEELARVSALATLEGFRDQTWEVADIALIHQGIFEPVFGEKTLGFRSLRKHGVQFPIVTGTKKEPHPGGPERNRGQAGQAESRQGSGSLRARRRGAESG